MPLDFDPEQMIHPRMRAIDASGIRRVFDLAANLDDPINLSIGQPDFDVPEPIKQAAANAIASGHNRYTVTQGIAELRDAVRQRLIDELPNWETGLTSGDTGTLIGPRHVLTAGHCVYNIRNDRWYSRLAFSPGQNGGTRPYGKIAWKRAISVRGWTKRHKRNYDYAMIVLAQDIGNRVGWMGYGWKRPMPKYNVNINGYPGDKPSGTMWHSFCGLKIIRTYRLYYACDTFGGMSGSGVYVYFKSSNKRTIYGIHAYGVDSTGYNGATRIRKAVFQNLKKWKARY